MAQEGEYKGGCRVDLVERAVVLLGLQNLLMVLDLLLLVALKAKRKALAGRLSQPWL